MPRIQKSIVQAIASTLPKLYLFGHDAIATPERRQWYFFVNELPFHLVKFSLEQ